MISADKTAVMSGGCGDGTLRQFAGPGFFRLSYVRYQTDAGSILLYVLFSRHCFSQLLSPPANTGGDFNFVHKSARGLEPAPFVER
jgi:hypothetical protein